MKIVLYANTFLPNIGGREIVMHYLARAFKMLGHQVRVVGPGGLLKHRKFRFGYPVHRWPLLGSWFKEQLMLLEAWADIRLWGCDLFHAHNTFPSGYIAAVLKKKLNIPLIITPHGVDIHVIPEIGFGQRLHPDRRKKIEYAIDKADLCTAISDSIKNSLIDAGTDEQKIRMVSNGVDFSRFQTPSGINVREWLGLKEATSLIVTVGNYHPRKGQDILIRSMPMVLERHPDARLLIVGRETKNLAPLISRLSLTDKVFLIGSIEFPYYLYDENLKNRRRGKDLLAAIYQDSDVYVSAGMSEGSEGLSLAVIEAMAAGLPILASDISGNRDLIQDGVTGYLFAPNSPDTMADAIISILGDNKKRTELSAAGKKIAEQYDWLNIARHYLEVYEEAVRLHSGHGRP